MEERIKTLGLLEEGKVNVDEAVRLLEALDCCCDPHHDECCESGEDCCGSGKADSGAHEGKKSGHAEKHSEERRKVLDLLEGGKVSADEATRLLNALQCNCYHHTHHHPMMGLHRMAHHMPLRRRHAPGSGCCHEPMLLKVVHTRPEGR